MGDFTAVDFFLHTNFNLSLGVYNTHMETFHNDGKVDIVTSPESQAAVLLVLESISRFPQSGQGETLIANKLLESFDKPGESGRNVTITDLANVAFDPVWAADKANRIHKAFGIKYVIGPEKVEKFVYSFATTSMEKLRVKTLETAKKMGLKKDLPETPVYINTITMGIIHYSSLSIYKKAAADLEEFLTAHDKVRKRVSAIYQKEAAKIKSETNTQRRNAQDKYSKKNK